MANCQPEITFGEMRASGVQGLLVLLVHSFNQNQR
jgi:hypothetical protein